MKIVESSGFDDCQPHPELYPALFPFRIIVDAADVPWDRLRIVLSSHDVREPLTAGRGSSSGKYLTLVTAVMVASRAELDSLYAELRAVPGVKFLL